MATSGFDAGLVRYHRARRAAAEAGMPHPRLGDRDSRLVELFNIGWEGDAYMDVIIPAGAALRATFIDRGGWSRGDLWEWEEERV